MTGPNPTRYRTLRSGGQVLYTVCAECGAKPAPFGFDGYYFCSAHRSAAQAEWARAHDWSPLMRHELGLDA